MTTTAANGWQVPQLRLLEDGKTIPVAISGVPWVLAHLDEVVVMALAGIGAGVGTAELLGRGMVANACALLLVGLALACVFGRLAFAGLAVSREGIRVRRLLSTARAPWSQVEGFDIAPGPGPLKQKWCVLRIQLASGSTVNVLSIRRPAEISHHAGGTQEAVWRSVDAVAQDLRDLQHAMVTTS